MVVELLARNASHGGTVLPPRTLATMLALSTPPLLSLRQPLHPKLSPSIKTPNQVSHKKKKKRDFKCRSDFSQDAPFAIAIGGSILNSLAFPVPEAAQEDDPGSAIDSTDARFAVMGIISFIPYFNWLSWIFAWLDTGSPRYVVYSIIYLAPYIRTNLSLSPEESWLPIASIIFGIIHVQVEASVRNGDLQSFQLFKETGTNIKFRQEIFEKRDDQEQEELPSAHDHSRNELHGWGAPEKPLDPLTEENEDADE